MKNCLWKHVRRKICETGHSKSNTTFFRHSAVLSLPALLLRPLCQKMLIKGIPRVQQYYFSSFDQPDQWFLALSLPSNKNVKMKNARAARAAGTEITVFSSLNMQNCACKLDERSCLQTCSEDKDVRWFNAAHESILGVKWFTMALK